MVKRHTANALHIAKCMGRKGYALEGSVKDPNDPNQWLEFGGQDLSNAPAGLPIGQSAGTSLGYHTLEGLAGGAELTKQAIEGQSPDMSNPETVEKVWNAAGIAQMGGFGGVPAKVGETVLGSGPIRRINDEYIPHSNPKREQNLHDWLGESVVKNPDGSPKVVYHGSGADFSVFRPSSTGEFGPGIYASSLADEATGYAWTHPEGTGPNVMPIHIRMEQPFVAKNPSDFWEAFGGKTDAEAMQNARKAGYDGVIITRPYTIYDSKRKQFYPTGQDHTHYVVFDPSQIKSATGNSGHFSLQNPDVTKSEGGRAGYLAGGMPEVIDLETEVPDDTSSFDSSDDSPANFFRQDKELQQSHPEMFQQKTYKPYTALDDAPAATPARQPMAYAPSDTPSRGPAMDAISGATSSGGTDAPRPIPPGNIPNVPQAKNVDPRLFNILNAAGKNLPEGWSWNVTPSGGFRPDDPRFHGKGMAVDVQLVDDQGRALPNYQNAAAFRAYEQFAQAARKAQLDLHPELSDQLRWGGYFSGPVGKYGAKDLMHFDLGGNRVPMGGGSWETGLYDRERRYLPGAKSVGMGNYARGGRTYPIDDKSDWNENKNYKKTGGELTHMSPDAFLARTEPLKMDHDDKKAIHHFKKKLENGEKLDPAAIYPEGGQDGRHHAMAAKKLGIKKIPVLTWPKKAEGGSIVDRAIMVMSKQAKGPRGRP